MCHLLECLLQQLMNVGIVGTYDATVVHADNEAIPFFERCGFTSDIVLNSRWRFWYSCSSWRWSNNIHYFIIVALLTVNLNSCYVHVQEIRVCNCSELADQFTNCSLMCYLPPFTSTSTVVYGACICYRKKQSGFVCSNTLHVFM